MSARAPSRILQLPEEVINRIAAGEVVVRPANALKELLENSLDAGSRNISVTARGGGLKTLRIEDDGHGISKDDLPILCERFTTSKLKKYEDLQSIGTFGFRGEALASISHVAHVTVTTMTPTSPHAWVAEYSAGLLRAPPRASAGVPGTTLVVEDMFYNNSIRRGALGKETVEHSKLLEVVQKYAIHNPTVSFSCRKAGGAVAELHTQGGASATSSDAIAVIYGQSLAKELFPFEASCETSQFKCHGFATGPQWSSRGGSLTLFINHRLVECSSLKRAIEAVYTSVLPRHQHPWVYLALELEPSTVDVNVHPTKMEVQFLHEQLISERVQEALAARLRERGGSRTFDAQLPLGASLAGSSARTTAAALSGARPAGFSGETASSRADSGAASGLGAIDGLAGLAAATPPTVRPAQAAPAESGYKPPAPARVRVDHRQRSLESVFRQASSQALVAADESAVPQEDRPEEALVEGEAARAFEEAQQLTSICELKEAAALAGDAKLSKTLSQSVFVGPIDRDLALLQCGATLCLVNLARLAEECAYQRLLRSFGDVAALVLKEPLPVKDLLRLGIQDPDSGYDPEMHARVDVDALVARFAALLEEKADMLAEYIALEIADGLLGTLPNALGVASDQGLALDELPLFLLRLCCETNWMEEKPCLASLCRLAADFCVKMLLPSEEDAASVAAQRPPLRTAMTAEDLNSAVERGEFADVAAAAVAASTARKRMRTTAPNALSELKWLHELVRGDGACLWPGCYLKDGTVLELVSLDQLYKIFERC